MGGMRDRAAEARPSPSLVPLGPRGGPTCSRCRTLLARRSNTTSVWSSLPEMMCRSSASSASTALECSRLLFSRAGPTSRVRRGGGRHQSPSEAARPPLGPRAPIPPGTTLGLLCPPTSLPACDPVSLLSCPCRGWAAQDPQPSAPSPACHPNPICSQYSAGLSRSQHKMLPPAGGSETSLHHDPHPLWLHLGEDPQPFNYSTNG